MAMCKALVIECAHDVSLVVIWLGPSSHNIIMNAGLISGHDTIPQLYT